MTTSYVVRRWVIGHSSKDKDFGSSNTTTWKDYGNYDQTAWSTKGTSNEFDADQIHFPNIGTTGSGRGWAIDSVVEVGTGYIKLGNGYGLNNNVGFGVTNSVKIVHDNTYAFTQAIDATMTSGGNYLDLPSGTYLTNRIVIPSSFTIKGNGKNSILKMQYFASDSEDGNGNALSKHKEYYQDVLRERANENYDKAENALTIIFVN